MRSQEREGGGAEKGARPKSPGRGGGGHVKGHAAGTGGDVTKPPQPPSAAVTSAGTGNDVTCTKVTPSPP